MGDHGSFGGCLIDSLIVIGEYAIHRSAKKIFHLLGIEERLLVCPVQDDRYTVGEIAFPEESHLLAGQTVVSRPWFLGHESRIIVSPDPKLCVEQYFNGYYFLRGRGEVILTAKRFERRKTR